MVLTILKVVFALAGLLLACVAMLAAVAALALAINFNILRALYQEVRK